MFVEILGTPACKVLLIIAIYDLAGVALTRRDISREASVKKLLEHNLVQVKKGLLCPTPKGWRYVYEEL